MRTFLFIMGLALGGCSVFGTVEPLGKGTVSTSLPPAGQQAQLAVNEANLGLTAAANVIASNVKDGIWTKQQAQGYLNKVRDYSRQVDRAQDLIRLGDFAKGKTEAEAVRALIVLLHREIAAQARKETQ
jgi:hypothetical protein